MMGAMDVVILIDRYSLVNKRDVRRTEGCPASLIRRIDQLQGVISLVTLLK